MKDWGQFFKSVMPTMNGTCVVVRGYNGAANEQTFTTLQGLIDTANAWEAATQADNKNTWFSIGLLPEVPVNGMHERRAELVQANRVLALDVDVRAGDARTYATKEEAAQAIARLVASGELVKPSWAIDSGGGIHLYWCLNRDLSPTELAQRGTVLADTIRRLDPRLGKDAHLSKNPVGLFRVPGSFNVKYNPPVRVDLYNDPAVSDQTGTTYGPEAVAVLPQAGMPAVRGAGGGMARSIGAPAPIIETALDYYTGCAVMRFIRDHRTDPPASPNYIGYQPWRLAMALLSYTQDAEVAAQDISAGAFTYSYTAAAKQMRAEKDQYGRYAPITCGALCDSLPPHVGRSLCAGCPFFKTASGTPYRAACAAETARHVALNAQKVDKAALIAPQATMEEQEDEADYEVPEAPELTEADYLAQIEVAREDDDYIASQKAATLSVNPTTQLFDAAAIGLVMDGELAAGTGVVSADVHHGTMTVAVKDDPKDPNSPVENYVAAKAVFWPVRFVVSAEASKRALQIAVMKLEDNKWLGRYVVCDYKQLLGRTDMFATELAGIGVVLDFAPKLRIALHKWFTGRVQMLREKDVMSRYTHFGWNDDGKSFVLGPYKFRGRTVEIANMTSGLASIGKNTFRLRGSRTGARSALTFAARYGSDAMRFAIMAGAGAPAMPWTSQPGAYINLYGYNGQGKSLTGSFISGIWGNGAKNGAAISSKDTLNARYAKLSAMCNLPLVHEEATTLHREVNNPASDVGKYLFEVSEGKGKGRATKDGSLAEELNWSTIVFATSNVAIRDEMTIGDEQRAAQIARAYEILFDAPAIDLGAPSLNNTIMGRLGEAIDASSGAAGMLLASYYAANRDKVIEFTRMINNYLASKETSTSAEQRVHRAILTAAYVGQYVLSETGLWNLTMEDAEGIIRNVDTKVKAANLRVKLDVERVMSDITAALQAYTAVVRPNSGAGRTIPGSAFGVLYEPKLELRCRFDIMDNDTMVLFTVNTAMLTYMLKQRGINYEFFVRAARTNGKHVLEGMCNLHSQIHAANRDNRNVDMAMPPVMCTTFAYAAMPSTSVGGIPSLDHML